VKLAGRSTSRGELLEAIGKAQERLGFKLRLDSYCWTLSMGERQKLELLKAAILEPKLLILDEPTTHITPHEFTYLSQLLRSIAREGKSVIFVTHKVREALSVADRIAVMRKGRVVGVLDNNGGVSEELLLKLMFGDVTIDNNGDSRVAIRGLNEPLLEVRDLWVLGSYGQLALKGVSFTVRRGEILGVAGIAGNGQRELFETIVGLRRPIRGHVILLGEDVTRRDASYRVKRGLAVIPEERLGWGLAPGLSIVANVTLSLLHVDSRFRGFLVDWRAAREAAMDVVSLLEVKHHSLDMPVDSLSGGNMQRLIVARELYKRPKVIVAMNPTGGLDVKTARAVRRMLVDYARDSAILVISEDLEELVSIADRIIVLSKGSISGVFSKPFNVEDISRAMTS